MNTPADRPARIELLLTSDHDRLESLFHTLLDSYASQDWNVVRPLWRQLEAAVTAHLDAEEAYVLPAFETFDPLEAGALRREHDEFRRQLVELGVAMDLHLVSFDVARAFVRALREHANREEALMYAWARQHLERARWEAIETRLASEPPPRVRGAA